MSASVPRRDWATRTPLTTEQTRWLLWGMIALWILILIIGQSLKYYWWGQGYDQIDYEQSIWNTTQGRFLEISHYRHTDHLWGMDFSPAILLLVPLYVLFPSAYTLIVIQAVFMAVGALPIYAIARRRFGGDPRAGLLWSAGYLLYPSLQFVTMTAPWQPRTLAVPALLGAFWAFEQRRFSWYIALLVLALTTRTDVALVVIAFGLLALVWRRPIQWWFTPIVLGGLWLVISTSVLVPAFYRADYQPQTGALGADYATTWPGKSPQLAYYSHLGASVGEIITTIVTHPLQTAKLMFTGDKITYLFLLLLPLLFTPLLAPDVAVLAAPIIGMNLLSTRVYQFTIREQYQTLVIPGLILAAIVGSARLWQWSKRRFPNRGERWLSRIAVGFIGYALVINVVLKNPVLVTLRYHEKPERIGLMEAFRVQIPPDARVAATSFLAPRLLPRQHLYYLPNAPMFPSLDQADYLFIDARSAAMRESGQLAQFQAGPEWRVVRQDSDLWLFERVR